MSRVYQVGDWVAYAPWRQPKKHGTYGRVEDRWQAYPGRPWAYSVCFNDGHRERDVRGRYFVPYRPTPLEIRDWEIAQCLAELTK